MLDDEVELREVGRRVVHVGDVEGVLVQRPDRRALVDVDVLHAQLLRPGQEAVGLRVFERPAARAVQPLGGVELDSLGLPAGDVCLELLHRRVTAPWLEAAVDDELARVLLGQLAVLRRGVEALGVPGLQVGRLEDRDVDVPVLEDVLHQALFGVLLEPLDRPVGLGRPQRLVGVEAVDPPLGEVLLALLPVLRTRVPVVHVAVHHEVLLAVLLVHGRSWSRRCWDVSREGSVSS